MATTSTTGTTGTNAILDNTITGAKAKSTNAMDNLDFTTYITLLTVQLKNQDPMKPMDSQQFTSEIATYAQLEQQIKGNDLLEKMSSAGDYSMQAVAAGYLGKEVLAEDNQISFDGTHIVDFGYDVKAEGATNTELEIINNATGEVVKSTKVDSTEGLHAISWDGRKADGTAAAAGTYTVRVKSNDADGTVVATNAMAYTTATEMINQDGELYIKTGSGSVIGFADIQSVRTKPVYN